MGKQISLSVESVVTAQHMLIALENNPTAKERVLATMRDNGMAQPERQFAALRKEVFNV